MSKNNDWIIFDGSIIDEGEAVVSAQSRGLMYGDGIFETFRTYAAKTLFLEQHLQRLFGGLEVLGIPLPPLLKIENLKPLICKLLEKKGLLNGDAIIRIQVWREGQRGYLPASEAASGFSITASECSKSFKNPVLATVETRRIPSQALPVAYKFSNGINYILAAKEASRKGADDALMQTISGKISETTIANIFWCKGGKIFTPDDECDLIPGITRKIVIDLAVKENGIETGAFELNEILEADAVFMTNSVREILPVKAIDDHFFDTENDIVKRFIKQFSKFRNEYLQSL